MDSDESSVVPIEPIQPIKIFYCYARKDKRFRDMLEKYLNTMKRSSWVSSWHDSMINAGEDWERKINEQIKAANVILLLISPDFMHSDYCYSIEMRCALERHEAKKARVIPIILRPTDWEDAPFSKLPVLPTNTRPLTRWQDRDEAFLDIAKGIRKAVRELLLSQKTADQWVEDGRSFSHLERFEDALTAFTHAIDLAPYNAMAYSDKGIVLEKLGCYKEALQLYEQAINIALGSIEGREDFILQKLSVSRGIETRAVMAFFYSNKGRTLLLLSRLEECLIAYDQAIDLVPVSEIYFGRALAFIKLQCYGEAVSDFEQAIDLAPNNEEIYLYYTYKGIALSNLERTEEALSAYEQALALNPDYLLAYTSKGVLLGKLQRFEEALVPLEQAIQLDPNSAEAYNAKADCHYELEDYEAALAAYQQVTNLDDNDYYAFCGVGEALSKLDRNKEAVRAFDAAICINPNNIYAYRRKADILEDLGHDFESRVIMSHMELIDTHRDDGEDDLLLDISDPERLLASCEQEIQNDPQNLTFLVFKCVALLLLDRYQEAYDLYTILLQNYPDLERGVQGPTLRYFHFILEMRLKNHNSSMAEHTIETTQNWKDLRNNAVEDEDQGTNPS